MRRDAFNDVHDTDDAAAVMDNGKSPAQLVGFDRDASGEVTKRHPVGCAAGMNEQRAAIVGRPGAVLNVLEALDDARRPGLADRENLHVRDASLIIGR